MPEKNITDEEINRMLKAFDTSIDVPDAPDILSSLDNVQNPVCDKKVIPFKKLIYSVGGIAAAILILVAVYPVLKDSFIFSDVFSKNSTVFEYSLDSEETYELSGNESFAIPAETPEEPAPKSEENYSDSEENSIGNEYIPDDTNNANPADFSGNDSKSFLYNVLSGYYAANEGYTYIGTSPSVSDFTVNFSKKRCAEVDISDDSVSVIVYDDSGEREILTAFWIEGSLVSSQSTDSVLTLEMDYVVTLSDLESGNYLPEVSDENGIREIDENSFTVSDEIKEPVIHMTAIVNAENGSVYISGFVS